MAVYFLRAGDDGPVKIGHTRDIKRRLPLLRTGCPAPISVIREIAGGLRTEMWLHRRFSSAHRFGEWFDYVPEMLTVEPPAEALPGSASPAERVIAKFGGERAVAEMLRIAVSTVYRWTWPHERGGCAGIIPRKRQDQLLAKAKEKRVDLTRLDFFEVPAAPKRKRPSASAQAAD